jgi:FlaA1/EpsC-like NDP-sugar epimerase/O-antigen ligase
MTVSAPGGERSSIASMLAVVLSARHDPAARMLNLDLLAVLIAALLPWSTSGVAIVALIWLVALIPTLDLQAFARSLRRPISALPIALFALAVLGTLWSDASWGARLYAIGPTAKLLMLPLLFYHFERSTRGMWVFTAFLVSCTLLMAVSWVVAFDPGLTLKPQGDAARGIFVKNYIDQSQEFALCAVALAYPIVLALRQKRIRLVILLIAISLSFVANMALVIVSRTALVTMPIMLAVFAALHLKWRSNLMILSVTILLAGLAWVASPQLRWTATTFVRDYQVYRELGQPTSIGTRLEFWQKSLRFFAEAPIIGHGTGSTRGLFAQAATGPEVLAAGQVIGNPHNQTLNVAVQWGIAGVIGLYAMWWFHLLLFRGEGQVAWIGLLVVVQNVFTSLFNSHLFDFHEGWMYVLGVGIAGGMTLRARSEKASGCRQVPASRDGWHARHRWAISNPGNGAATRIVAVIGRRMTRFSNLTLRNFLIVAHDALATALALFASFYLRFEGDAFFVRLPLLLRFLPYFILLSIVVCYIFNLTTTKWRFFSLPDALNILRAATVLTLALLVLDYIFVAPNIHGSPVAPNMVGAFFAGKVTIILYWFLEIFFLSGTRFLYRYFRYTRARYHARTDEDAAPALLIGRAADAEVLLRAIESGAVKRLWPVGVLSPSPADRGQMIRSIPVLGGIDDLDDVIEDFAKRGKPIARVVMAPSAFESEARPESVLMRARRHGLIVSRLPSLESGDAPRLTAVAVEDLLLRPSEKIDYARLEALVKNKSVIVTGGGGSIGSEICDRVATFGAARLLVIENSEPALYAVVESLTAKNTEAAIEGRIADIRDRDRIHRLMSEFKPDIVFHAAALKHVPILERDWSEGVKTNIFGSVNVADAALAAGAEAMVMISTDKAIEPVSMLGLTKRFAEMYCQALDHDLAGQLDGKPRMRLISVRFGNVLASNGSVVPKFKAQIEAGGPVTVTHPDMVRYFMTIREACDLVLTAATHALAPVRPDVSVYVLNMGQPVKIVDLAERMIRLSGLQPGHDIEIVFTGMRPGERLNEILFASEEPTIEIGVAGIMAAKPNEPPMQTLRQWIEALEQAIARDDRATIRAVLKDAVPEFGSAAPVELAAPAGPVLQA